MLKNISTSGGSNWEDKVHWPICEISIYQVVEFDAKKLGPQILQPDLQKDRFRSFSFEKKWLVC